MKRNQIGQGLKKEKRENNQNIKWGTIKKKFKWGQTNKMKKYIKENEKIYKIYK